MKVPLLDLKAQYKTIKAEIREALEEVLESQQFILGPGVAGLEEEVAAYCGCQHAVGVSSGSDALLICLMAEKIGPGDEVITTPYTFFATAGAIVRVGAKPVFVDIEPDTYNMDPERIEVKISPRTRAIIPVHLFGQCADMNHIMQIARKRDLVVIEDAAQAIGAEYVLQNSSQGVRRAGAMGDYGCLSFFPSKNLGAFGDGGMVVTNDPDRAETLKILRGHGSKPKYYHRLVGGNFRLDALQAAVLSAKLRHLDEWTKKRQKNAGWYDRTLKASGLEEKGLITLPKPIWKEKLGEVSNGEQAEAANSRSHYHIYNQYVVSTPERDKLRSYFASKDIGTEVYYPVPLHLQECFKGLGYQKDSLPISEGAARTTLALPVYPELTSEQQMYVADAVIEGLS